MKFRSSTFIALLCCSFSVAASGAAPRNFTIVSPPNGAFVESTAISLMMRIESKNIDDIRVEVGGKKQNLDRRPMERIYACFQGIRLAPGMNELRIIGLKEGKKVEELNYRLFYRTDLAADANTAPYGFARYYFHTPDHEKECTACHKLDFSGAEENPSAPEKSPCFVCHRKMMAGYRQAHGPAAVWSCSMCHDVRAKGRKMATPQPIEKVCKGCHENDWQKKKFRHGPTAAGECTACHNPHAADEPLFLRLKPFNLCIACHEETASRPHVISGFSGAAGHPVRMSPDPLNPGRDFTCASCHNPHASDFQYLLGSDYSSMSRFCQTCHRM